MTRLAAALLALTLALGCNGMASAQQTAIVVDGNIALSSLVALADGHLQTVADALELLAATKAARAGDWGSIGPRLQARLNAMVPSVMWYARPDGSYWTVEGGKQIASIADRPYFARLLAGQTVIGELVVSRSTGRAVAVVAVPVVGSDGTVTGVLGASIYLDRLSEQIAREMSVGPGAIFWAIDSHGTIAIHSDTSNIFVQPATISPALKAVTADMLSHESGSATYTYRGRTRTVIYRRSVLTGWHFGFGVLH